MVLLLWVSSYQIRMVPFNINWEPHKIAGETPTPASSAIEIYVRWWYALHMYVYRYLLCEARGIYVDMYV